MVLEALEERLQNLEKLTHDLAVEVHDNDPGPVYEYCTNILGKLKTPAAIISKDYKIIYMNQSALDHIKEDLGKEYVTIGNTCYKELYRSKSVCPECAVKQSIENRSVYIVSYTSLKGLSYLIISLPLIYNGTSGAIELFVPQ